MSGVVRWEDPPVDGRVQSENVTKWERTVNMLATQPGKWALVAEAVTDGMGSYLRKSQPALEITTRRVQNNPIRVDIYARYRVPEET